MIPYFEYLIVSVNGTEYDYNDENFDYDEIMALIDNAEELGHDVFIGGEFAGVNTAHNSPRDYVEFWDMALEQDESDLQLIAAYIDAKEQLPDSMDSVEESLVIECGTGDYGHGDEWSQLAEYYFEHLTEDVPEQWRYYLSAEKFGNDLRQEGLHAYSSEHGYMFRCD